GEVVEHHLLTDWRDAEQPHFAPQSLDMKLARVAEAAKCLERGVARLKTGVGAEQLGGIGLRSAWLLMIEQPGGFVRQQLGRLQLGPDARKRVRDGLVLADRTLENAASVGVA